MKPGSPDARKIVATLLMRARKSRRVSKKYINSKIFNALYMKYVAEYNVANTARELLKRG